MFAIVCSNSIQCAKPEGHMREKVKRERYGGIKEDLTKCIMAQVICVYIAAGKFIFHYSRYSDDPSDNSSQMFLCVPGVSKQQLQD